MSQFPYNDRQPAWISASEAGSETRVREFIRGVYAWMFGGLAITTAAALWVASSEAMQALVLRNRMVFFGLIIAEFALVMWTQVRITRMSAASAASAFLVYALLNGLTLSVIFFVYTSAAIFQAFATAAVMFGGMSLYGYMTKRDLTSMGTFLIMGMWGIFIGFIINMFLKSGPLGFLLSAVGVVVFLGLTAYDTQKLKAMATATELRENLAVLGALHLYLDFINLFLMLLRLFGGNRR
ncbi:MAG TPA: Bax inhibitor-1/YccA family protein [Thermoanaerobaculia bacterium]